MKRFLSLSMAVFLAGTVTILSFSEADARKRYYRNNSGAVAAGIVGGLIIGGAIANSANRRRNYEHCHRGYCHDHSYSYRNHSHEPVYQQPIRGEPRPVRREPRRNYGNSHEGWCYDRYRSYRSWDNTYQPYSGRRRQCRSPYG